MRRGSVPRDRADEARSHIVQYALERAGIVLGAVHFTLFKEAETVQVILEDAFGVEMRDDRDVVTPTLPGTGGADDREVPFPAAPPGDPRRRDREFPEDFLERRERGRDGSRPDHEV